MCSIINCTGKVIVKREFAGKIAQRPVIASAHINYIYGGIYIMLKIRYMGYNNTHPDGINMERRLWRVFADGSIRVIERSWPNNPHGLWIEPFLERKIIQVKEDEQAVN